MDELVYWVWLSLACTPGKDTFIKLFERFSSPKEIYSADDEAIASLIGSRSRDYKAITDRELKAAEKVLEFCCRRGVGILKYSDEAFPAALRKIETPPVLLYYRGSLPDFNSEFFVSVVGTRRLSDYGRRNAFSIAHDLSRAGAIIVSGMAIGIDAVAHSGALAADRPTVAVIGSGIDVCYPKQHLRLAREIVKKGCVLTEYAPGTGPERFNFPARNRIISGLCAATLVVEGKEKSGALITARYAKAQGRTVYALPGNVGNINSELTNLLIKNGAKLCTSADDIIRDFEPDSLGMLNSFSLTEKATVDMNKILSELQVSAVAQGDSIFRRSTSRKERAKKESKKPTETQNTVESVPDSVEKMPDLNGFDKKAVMLYKKIPLGEECSIETLIDDELSLRDVMKGLLKLEIGRFVTMLPGEKVKRNF